MNIRECPLGFEDGHIVGYRAVDSQLELVFEFWNAKRGTLVFEGYVGARDEGALGVEVGSFFTLDDSDLIESLVRRHYEVRPQVLDWKHFRFIDLDGDVMFEVVAPTCSFVECE